MLHIFIVVENMTTRYINKQTTPIINYPNEQAKQNQNIKPFIYYKD